MKFRGNCNLASSGIFLHKQKLYFTAVDNKMTFLICIFHLALVLFLTVRKEQVLRAMEVTAWRVDGSGPLLLSCTDPSPVFHLLAEEGDLQPLSAPSQLCSGLFLETGRNPSLVSSNPDYFIFA